MEYPEKYRRPTLVDLTARANVVWGDCTHGPSASGQTACDSGGAASSCNTFGASANDGFPGNDCASGFTPAT